MADGSALLADAGSAENRTGFRRADARRSLIRVTPQGKTALVKLKSALVPIDDAMVAWFEGASPGLIEALWQIERRARGGAFLDAIRAAARRREGETL